MSEREMCIKLLDTVPEYKIGYVLAYIQGLTVADEVADDAFCDALYEQYKDDPDKGQAVSLEDAARALGVNL